MGKSSNGWCKKLMAKAKKHNLKKALGTSGRFHVDAARDTSVKVVERNGLERRAMTRKRVGNGCMISPSIRAEIERRKNLRADFLQGLRDGV